jgi:hypothetical protein
MENKRYYYVNSGFERQDIWKKVNSRDDLPKDGRRCFLVMYKGLHAICEYNKEEDAFYIDFAPDEYGANKVNREHKIKWWMDLPDFPEDF